MAVDPKVLGTIGTRTRGEFIVFAPIHAEELVLLTVTGGFSTQTKIINGQDFWQWEEIFSSFINQAA